MTALAATGLPHANLHHRHPHKRIDEGVKEAQCGQIVRPGPQDSTRTPITACSVMTLHRVPGRRSQDALSYPHDKLSGRLLDVSAVVLSNAIDGHIVGRFIHMTAAGPQRRQTSHQR